jgi:hypothetical protein
MNEQTKTEQSTESNKPAIQTTTKPKTARPKKTKPVESGPTAMIQFVGKRRRINKKTGKPVLVDREAPKFIIDGTTKINLPPVEQQKKGMVFDAAAVSKAKELFPDNFKTPVKKGKK